MERFKDKRMAFTVGFICGAVLIAVLAIIGGCDSAQTQVPETVDATCGWSPPSYGTPAVEYVVQIQKETDPWATYGSTADTLMLIEGLEYFSTYKARVAGIDAQGRQGPWSLPSDPYNPSQAQPGPPVRVTIGG